MERRRSMTVWKDHQSVCLLSVKTALISKDNEISTALDFLHCTIKDRRFSAGKVIKTEISVAFRRQKTIITLIKAQSIN